MWTSIYLFLTSPLLKWVVITDTIGVIGLVLFFVMPAWLPLRLRNLCGVVGICSITAGAFYWYAFRAGEAHMVQMVAAKEAQTADRVKSKQKQVNDCNGGVDWDVTTGQCMSR